RALLGLPAPDAFGYARVRPVAFILAMVIGGVSERRSG
ncbi:MAG: hypothetical protein QOI75_566, partial [Pseudonocardiales bacterium]|nr:hypothetical protein [Pseudonocardiales bacterium]